MTTKIKQNLLALPLQSLAVKSVVQAAGVGALLITLPIIKIPPALQGSATVLPRVVKIQRAVAAVPSARVIVALRIADGVSAPAFALRNLAPDLHLRRRSYIPALPSVEGVVEDVTKEPIEVNRAGTSEKRSVVDGLARAPVVAGVGQARRVHARLALVSAEARRAETARAQVTGDTGGAVATSQGAAGF